MSSPSDVPSGDLDAYEGDSAAQRPEAPGGKLAFEPLKLESHRALISEQPRLFQRFNENPDLANLLLINPVLAFREVGVEMTPEIAHHVLHTRQHPPRQRQRREELEASLKEALGEKPRPEDPAWLAEVLFERLEVAPLKTAGQEPAYKPPLNEAAVKRLQALRPKRRQKLTREKGGVIRMRFKRPTLRRIDLDAKLPDLEPSDERPEELDLETLYFYKESHPLARDLLELGVIKRRAFPVHSGDSYRRIKEGLKKNAFRSWITAVRFPMAPDDEPDQ